MKHSLHKKESILGFSRTAGKIFSIIIGAGSIISLSGCGSHETPETFQASDYSYLPVLNLNVSRIETNNIVAQDDDSLVAKSPISPAQSLTLMAQQRLHPTGRSGIAHFVINHMSITKGSHHTLNATYKVALTLDDPQSRHHGSITAMVTRHDQNPEDTSLKHNLYELNQHMMDDMNVELEYQIRRNLADWLTDATGMPLNSTIHSQNLDNAINTSSSLPPLATSQQHQIATSPFSSPTGTAGLQEIPNHSSQPGSLHFP
ncbi:hypothetical protein GS501_09500 [Saccharibacter sp. 17.LH.SD]|uniref:hypothetical protein n=1 Tax=Saccharibacter sp. 17.LH.SD TaxID=2689393 RepID=UPI00136B762D|nr:hypothetical protein [Saccharibacter sp. 17.LH.SD]MXV45265.1 hypothetical protein [Saccharibacter sp. 17.LH.SD]